MVTRKKVTKKSAAKGSKKKVTKKVGKKAAARKKVSRKKTAVKKTPAKKKAAKKKVAKKPAKKKTSRKTAGKVARKKVAKKKVTKKAAKKTAKKTTSRKKVTKKQPSKKKVAAKKVSKKKTVTKKKVAQKKVTKKKTSKKKVSAKKTPTKKAPAKKAAAEIQADDKPVKRKIAISAAPVKRPTRIISHTPVNPADQVPIRPKRRKKVSDDQLIHGIAPYIAQKGEEYMNDAQLEHFRNILTAWKNELMEEVDRTVHHMQDEASNFPDPNDRATQESEFGLELRTRDRERKLLKKINQTLLRVEEGDYGYCEETGDEIGLKRLEARPVATLSVEAQERREVTERQYSDQDDRR